MKQLLLLRHAKSSRDDPKLDDHERPLNARGREDAPRIGAYMRKRKYLPDLVYCSTSKRTVETLELVRQEFGVDPLTEFLPSLYLASAPAIAKIVRGAPQDVGVLLVLAHNPGVEECAAAFLGEGETSAEREQQDLMDDKFPTAALAVIDFDVAKWKDAANGQGTLAEFVRLKDLD